MKLDKYYKSGQWTSRFAMIPIEHRDKESVVRFIRDTKSRVRYRGPRRKYNDPSSRNWYGSNLTPAGQAECLKEDATHFTVYPFARIS